MPHRRGYAVCGVNAIVSWRAGADPTELLAAVTTMNQRLAHRGPDAEGLWAEEDIAIGHTRLKIIDPTGGQQPRVSDTWVLSFNGEIYNYLQLRAELAELGCQFRDASDTEVLAVALQTWGAEAVTRLNGDFAFVAYDRTSERLILCRDRLGVKPLYMKVTVGDVIVSSEPKGILAGEQVLRPGCRPVLDRMGFLQTLVYGNPVPPATCFDGIESLRGGELVTVCVRTGKIDRGRYCMWVR